MIDLDHLQRLDNAAFPAPWSVVMSHGHDFWRTIYSEPNRYQVGTFDDDPSTAYIVALRNAAPALFAELRRLRAVCAEAMDLLAAHSQAPESWENEEWHRWDLRYQQLRAALAAKGEA